MRFIHVKTMAAAALLQIAVVPLASAASFTDGNASVSVDGVQVYTTSIAGNGGASQVVTTGTNQLDIKGSKQPWTSGALDLFEYSPALKGITSYFAAGTSMTGGSIAFKYSNLLSSINFIWGSVDNYNTVELYKSATLVAKITGDQILNAIGGISGTSYTNATIDVAGGFDSIKFSTTMSAFEFGNIVTTVAVPGPVAGAGLPALFGLAGVAAFVALRRKSAKAA